MQDHDQEQAWQAIRTQRLAVADLLESLDAAEWQHPSLCEGWMVQDVAAHLTLQQLGLLEGLGMFARSPGGMNRVIREAARRQRPGPRGRRSSRGYVPVRTAGGTMSGSRIARPSSTLSSTARTSRGRSGAGYRHRRTPPRSPPTRSGRRGGPSTRGGASRASGSWRRTRTGPSARVPRSGAPWATCCSSLPAAAPPRSKTSTATGSWSCGTACRSPRPPDDEGAGTVRVLSAQPKLGHGMIEAAARHASGAERGGRACGRGPRTATTTPPPSDPRVYGLPALLA
jgi:hypothetical protein